MLSYSIGADFWELDVHLSEDGVPVVIHDPTLTRTSDAQRAAPTRSPWRVSEFTLADLDRLDVGATPPDPASREDLLLTILQGAEDPESDTRHRIPTLRQAFLLTKAFDWLVNVEIKWDDDQLTALTEQTVRLVLETGMLGRVHISSFDEETILRAKTLEPRITTGIITKTPFSDPVAAVRRLGADAFHPKASLVTEEDVRRCAEAGIPVIVWTVNEPEEMERFADLGVFGIITDRPHVLVHLKKRRGARQDNRP
jgi:glycerophosphoryl diester phosphodiesterase